MNLIELITLMCLLWALTSATFGIARLTAVPLLAAYLVLTGLPILLGVAKYRSRFNRTVILNLGLAWLVGALSVGIAWGSPDGPLLARAAMGAVLTPCVLFLVIALIGIAGRRRGGDGPDSA